MSSAADEAPSDARASPGESAARAGVAPTQPPEPPFAGPQARARRRKRLVREYVEAALLALALALAVRVVALETFRIPTASMAPSLLAGDHVLVSKITYGLRLPLTGSWLARWREVRRGDVVVFDHPSRRGEVHVKRVVGVPGDVIEVRGQVLHVNGVPQPRERIGDLQFDEQSTATGAWWSETCALWRERLARDASAREDAAVHDVLQCRQQVKGEREGPFEVVKDGHLFVAGDNRDRSDDGRAAGGWQLPTDLVIGKAVGVLWSWGPDGARAGRGASLRVDRLFKPLG